MKTEIINNPPFSKTYDLWVNNKKEMESEGFTIVHNVRDSLLGIGVGSYMEVDEIAYQIKNKNAKKGGTK